MTSGSCHTDKQGQAVITAFRTALIGAALTDIAIRPLMLGLTMLGEGLRCCG